MALKNCLIYLEAKLEESPFGVKKVHVWSHLQEWKGPMAPECPLNHTANGDAGFPSAHDAPQLTTHPVHSLWETDLVTHAVGRELISGDFR